MNTTPENSTGPETWVPEAIAEQEEYLRRIHPCEHGRAHVYRTFRPSGPGSHHHADLWSACIVCGVTETQEDYLRSLRARK